MPSKLPCILFTAFEPSGDEHAAPVIAELRRLAPQVPICALGGPRMADAGAELIAHTCGRGSMGASSLAEIGRHFKRVRVLKRWMAGHQVAIHVPTDSPAANWGIMKTIKKRYDGRDGQPPAKVVNLVAPQVWAWGSWRVNKLRRWSDLVLCLLPFEPQWFAQHRVKARFIGHPLFDQSLPTDALAWEGMNLSGGSPRIVLLPGSRPSEIKDNWPDLLEAFRRLSAEMDTTQGVVVAVHERAANKLRRIAGDRWPTNLKLLNNNLDAALHWGDVTLAVSGTVTLHVARHGLPMAVMYHVNRFNWTMLGQFIVRARTFTLPNLIAAGAVNPDPAEHIVREFIPYFGDVDALVDEMRSLLTDNDKRAIQIEALKQIIAKFEGHNAGLEAAEAILETMESR